MTSNIPSSKTNLNALPLVLSTFKDGNAPLSLFPKHMRDMIQNGMDVVDESKCTWRMIESIMK